MILDKYYISFSYKDIAPYLSPLGQALISGSKEKILLSGPEGQIFKGTIDGKYPVTAIVSEIYNDGSMNIKYWYDKYKIPIEWSGTFVNNRFALSEERPHEPDAEAVGQLAKIEAVLNRPYKDFR